MQAVDRPYITVKEFSQRIGKSTAWVKAWCASAEGKANGAYQSPPEPNGLWLIPAAAEPTIPKRGRPKGGQINMHKTEKGNFDTRSVYNLVVALVDAGYLEAAAAVCDVADTLPVPTEIKGGVSLAAQTAYEAIDKAIEK